MSVPVPDEKDELSKAVLDEYWRTLESKIVKRAQALADRSGSPLTVAFVGKAAVEVAPGCPCDQPSWRNDALPLLGPIVVVPAIMALVFGGFALFGTGDVVKSNQTTFLDIAKVLAGAVVGSTTGAAVAASRR